MLDLQEVRESDLMDSIYRKRKEMLEVAAVKGLVNNDTVKQSHELDTLIVIYQKRFTRICDLH